eukprot:578390-Heterocapsa_arctica.AAC.1
MWASPHSVRSLGSSLTREKLSAGRPIAVWPRCSVQRAGQMALETKHSYNCLLLRGTPSSKASRQRYKVQSLDLVPRT